MHDEPIDLARITAPTLVLAGKDDHLARTPERLAVAIPARAAAACRAPTSAFSCIPFSAPPPVALLNG